MTPESYKALRQARGTQKQVAGLLGIDRVTVAKREAGKLKIDREAELAIWALEERELRHENEDPQYRSTR